MKSVGLRELRQSASDVMRLVESGEEVEVTVQGRPAGLIVPIDFHRRHRRTMSGAELFERAKEAPPSDPTWAEELRTINPPEPLIDPWENR
jgi:prevent-host-death family protein